MSSTSGLAMVDGHVHFHHGFEASPFLENAHANFEDAARGMSLGASFVGMLLLTEGKQENGFQRLIAQSTRTGAGVFVRLDARSGGFLLAGRTCPDY